MVLRKTFIWVCAAFGIVGAGCNMQSDRSQGSTESLRQAAPDAAEPVFVSFKAGTVPGRNFPLSMSDNLHDVAMSEGLPLLCPLKEVKQSEIDGTLVSCNPLSSNPQTRASDAALVVVDHQAQIVKSIFLAKLFEGDTFRSNEPQIALSGPSTLSVDALVRRCVVDFNGGELACLSKVYKEVKIRQSYNTCVENDGGISACREKYYGDSSSRGNDAEQSQSNSGGGSYYYYGGGSRSSYSDNDV
jgi:hypothetical protein